MRCIDRERLSRVTFSHEGLTVGFGLGVGLKGGVSLIGGLFKENPSTCSAEESATFGAGPAIQIQGTHGKCGDGGGIGVGLGLEAGASIVRACKVTIPF